MTNYRLSHSTPEAAHLLRVVLFLALVGAAVLATGQLMQRAQKPARQLLGV